MTTAEPAAEPPRAARRAILIGVSDYDDPGLEDVLAAKNSLAGMRELLTDQTLCGWAPESITEISNPRHAGLLADQISELAAATTDVLLLYFVGHGTTSRDGNELCLAVSDTRQRSPEATGLRYPLVTEALLDCVAPVKIVILDCCYAGRAIPALGPDDLHELTKARGVHTLTATTGNQRAPLPTDQASEPTIFTGALIELVRRGLPAGAAELTLVDLFPPLRDRLRELRHPAPNQNVSETVGQHVFTKNPQAMAVDLTEDEQQRLNLVIGLGEYARTRRGFSRRLTMSQLFQYQYDPCPTVARRATELHSELAGSAWARRLTRARQGLTRQSLTRRLRSARPVALAVPVVAVALVVAAAVRYQPHRPNAAGTAADVTWQRTYPAANDPNGQCVGVTDGASGPRPTFNSQSPTIRGLLTSVGQRNAAEAKAARDNRAPLVTVVLATALSTTGWTCDAPVPPASPQANVGCDPLPAGARAPLANDDMMVKAPSDIPSGAGQVRGALAAICAYDADSSLPSNHPRLRLLVANVGSRFAYADAIATALAQARPTSPVVGVLDLNQSQKTTEAALTTLDKAGLTILGSTPAADSFTALTDQGQKTYSRFFRIGADNDRAVQVLDDVMTGNPQAPRPGNSALSAGLAKTDICLIEYADKSDLYSANLAEDVLNRVKPRPRVLVYGPGKNGLSWQSNPNKPGGQPGQDGQDKEAACRPPQGSEVKKTAFFFTGRIKDLRDVMTMLDLAGYDRAIPIFGGDDVPQLLGPDLVPLNRDVYFTEGGFDDLSAYKNQSRDRNEYTFQPFVNAIGPIVADNGPFGKTMVGFDAAWVMLHALAAVDRSQPGLLADASKARAASDAITNWLSHTCDPIRGATGLTLFDRQGNRIAPLVVVHMLPAGQTQVSHSVSNGTPTAAVLNANMPAGRCQPSAG